MGPYEVPLSVSFGFLDRDYVSQLPCVRYYVFVQSSFKYARRAFTKHITGIHDLSYSQHIETLNFTHYKE